MTNIKCLSVASSFFLLSAQTIRDALDKKELAETPARPSCVQKHACMPESENTDVRMVSPKMTVRENLFA